MEVRESLLSCPVQDEVVSRVVSIPVRACIVGIQTVVYSAMDPVVVERARMRRAAVQVVRVGPRAPSSTNGVGQTMRVVDSRGPAVLYIARCPPRIVVAGVRDFVVVVWYPFVTANRVVRSVAGEVGGIMVGLVHVVVLLDTRARFMYRFVDGGTYFLARFTDTRSDRHYHASDRPSDGRWGWCSLRGLVSCRLFI